jgi:glycosyltransferase involved in cell wall biosynthesis
MSRVCLYYRVPPESDRWLPGDRFIRPMARRAIYGKPRPGGVDQMFANLCLGLDRIGVPYVVNLPFRELKPDDHVGVLGRGRHSLDGYDRSNPIVAGIGLMTHPSEWPTLCEEYPVALYLQHSQWATDVYRPYFKERCRTWPVGIDTQMWQPAHISERRVDFLIYDKILWQREQVVPALLTAIREELARRKLTFVDIRYGAYSEPEYQASLASCRAMIFLCEHESQGLACQGALASDVPVLAWDQGRYLDPNRVAWGQPDVPATSVPYFDDRCGLTFRDVGEFPRALAQFLDLERSCAFAPRSFIVERLTLEKCSANFLDLMDAARREAIPARAYNGRVL